MLMTCERSPASLKMFIAAAKRVDPLRDLVGPTPRACRRRINQQAEGSFNTERLQALARGRRARRRVVGAARSRFAEISLALDAAHPDAARPDVPERCSFAHPSRICRPMFQRASPHAAAASPPAPPPASALTDMTQAELEQELDWAREALLSRVQHLEATRAPLPTAALG